MQFTEYKKQLSDQTFDSIYSSMAQAKSYVTCIHFAFVGMEQGMALQHKCGQKALLLVSSFWTLLKALCHPVLALLL